MNNYKTSVPVLIIFFNRPETLRQVFESVRKARPSVLFLAQDGIRDDHPDDYLLVEECRKIVNNVDWNCQVYKNYSDFNLSCDYREFTAISWAFEYTDRLLILEDDCVPCQSFFPFCEELLEKYKNDDRVDRICGFNRIEKYNDISWDYFFSTISSGYGWATWKRCWNEILGISDFSFLDDKDLCMIYKQSRNTIADRNYGDMFHLCNQFSEIDKKTGRISSWEIIVGVNSILNHKLIITPRFNMVKNVGAVSGSTHYSEFEYANSFVRRLIEMNTYDVSFPLKHPSHVIRNVDYEKKHFSFVHKNALQKAWMKLCVCFRYIKNGDFVSLKKKIKKRISK